MTEVICQASVVKASVTARYLAWVAPFISKDEERYYLNGIYIEPHPEHGALLVATDGSALAVVHDEYGVVDEPMIWQPSVALLSACKRKSLDAAARLDLSGPLARLTEEGEAEFHIVSTIDGQFPDWRLIVPNEAEAVSLPKQALNPELLARFRSHNEGGSVECSFIGNDAPIVVRRPQDPNFFGLLMPMKLAEKQFELFPEWIARAKPQAKAA